MTQEELVNLGLFPETSELYPNRWYVPLVGSCDIYESTTLYDIYKKIYETGLIVGEEEGKKLKQREFKQVLGI